MCAHAQACVSLSTSSTLLRAGVYVCVLACGRVDKRRRKAPTMLERGGDESNTLSPPEDQEYQSYQTGDAPKQSREATLILLGLGPECEPYLPGLVQ